MSIAGVGTLALVGILVWMLQRLRQDVENHQTEAGVLKTELTEARAARDDAQSLSRSAEETTKFLRERLASSTQPLDAALAQSRAEADALRAKIESVRGVGAGDSAAFWSRAPGRRIENYEITLRDSIPILLLANQKGGVGKTTLTANVAAAFAARGERVLTVDLDYQGSLTSLMLAQSKTQSREFPSSVDLLVGDSLPAHWPQMAIQAVSEKLHFISCWYSFEKLERNLEYRWVLGDTDDDIRFRLSRALLSLPVQDKYDRIIIDAPPRMTTGFLNGFCSATHLFVPTVVDNVSAVAVGTFARQFRELRTVLNPPHRICRNYWHDDDPDERERAV